MQADHIIKYHTDHPMMTPKLVGFRFIGAVISPISQENLLKGVKNIRNWGGQMPKIVKAKKSVAGFKLREGSDLLVLVTIRNSLYFLNYLNSAIIYNLLDISNSSDKNGKIRFGIKKGEKLGGAGVNIELFVKGAINGNRGLFFQSSLLIP